MRSDKMLRGKRRYIVFKLTEHIDSKSAHLLIYGQLLTCLGTFGLETVQYRFLKERFDEKSGTGIVRVNVETLNDVRRAFDLIKNKIKIIGVSGIIKKTQRFIVSTDDDSKKDIAHNDSKIIIQKNKKEDSKKKTGGC
jgi:RNase P/RNase MRP subunit POP5